MTAFWLWAIGLLFLAALFIVAPLWLNGRQRLIPAPAAPDRINVALFQQRCAELDDDVRTGVLDAAQRAAAQRDLERELLQDVGETDGAAAALPPEPARRGLVVLLTAGVVPLLALLLYLGIGQPQLTSPQAASPDATAMPPLDVLAAQLAERLEQTPDNVDGWLMLGQTCFALGQPAEALAAIERANALAPERTDVMLAYAEALAANHDNSFAGQPQALLEQVLRREPDNVNALWLSGMWAYQQGQLAAALAAWQRVLPQLDPTGEDAQALQQLLTDARQRGAASAPTQPAGTTP